MLVASLLLLLLNWFLINVVDGYGIISRYDDKCLVNKFEKVVYATPSVIRPLQHSCNGINRISANKNCTLVYRCLLDDDDVYRQMDTTCLPGGFWSFKSPSCIDNVVKLRNLVSPLKQNKPSKGKTDVTEFFKVGKLKRLVLGNWNSRTTPRPTTRVRMYTYSETTTAYTLGSNSTTSISPQNKTIASSAEPKSPKRPAVAPSSPKRNAKRQPKRPNMSSKMLSYLRLRSLCNETEMCTKASRLSNSCRHFVAGVRMLQLLCQSCVKYVCCTRYLPLLSFGNTCT